MSFRVCVGAYVRDTDYKAPFLDLTSHKMFFFSFFNVHVDETQTVLRGVLVSVVFYSIAHHETY